MPDLLKMLPDSNKPYGRLCEAVGLVFIQWAKLESEMAASLRSHLERQLRKKGAHAASLASAVYGSMRMKASRDIMKRIAQEHGYGEKALKFHEQLPYKRRSSLNSSDSRMAV